MINNIGWRLGVAIALAACDGGGQMPPGYQGIVELDERHLGFEVPGRIAAVPVARGQVVAAGAELSRLDDGLEKPVRAARAADLDAAKAQLALLRAGSRVEDVRAAEAQTRAAQAAQAKVETNLARSRTLLAQGAVNQSEVDNLLQDAHNAAEQVRTQAERARLLHAGARPEEVSAAEARVAAAAAALDAEDERLKRFVLVADAPLAVLDVLLKPGEVVAPGTPVLAVADTGHPYVDVFVPIAELPGVAVGRAAAVRVDGEAAAFDGAVEDIGRATEFTPRFLFSAKERPHLVERVRVRVADPGRKLHAGIPAFVTWR
jgi:HlyD family secretion protein